MAVFHKLKVYVGEFLPLLCYSLDLGVLQWSCTRVNECAGKCLNINWINYLSRALEGKRKMHTVPLSHMRSINRRTARRMSTAFGDVACIGLNSNAEQPLEYQGFPPACEAISRIQGRSWCRWQSGGDGLTLICLKKALWVNRVTHTAVLGA